MPRLLKGTAQRTLHSMPKNPYVFCDQLRLHFNLNKDRLAIALPPILLISALGSVHGNDHPCR